MSAPAYKLTYFNIQGAAEKVRLAFVLNGIPFEDARVNYAEWENLKPTTKFGQLPLLEVNGEQFAQSGAMLRFVGRLGDGSLYPSDVIQELRTNEMIGLSDDMDKAFYPALYYAIRPTMFGMDVDYSKTDAGKEHIQMLREKFVNQQLPIFLDHYVAYLKSSGGPFFGGEKPSIADCAIFPQLTKFKAGFMDHIPVTALDTHPEIIAYIGNMMAIPAIAEWYRKL